MPGLYEEEKTSYYKHKSFGNLAYDLRLQSEISNDDGPLVSEKSAFTLLEASDVSLECQNFRKSMICPRPSSHFRLLSPIGERM